MSDTPSDSPDPGELPLFLVVTIRPRPDRLEEAEAQLQSMRRSSVLERGCVFMHLTQPQDDPGTWVMLEMFRSRRAWDEHMAQPYIVDGNTRLADLLREPSDLRLLDGMPGDAPGVDAMARPEPARQVGETG